MQASCRSPRVTNHGQCRFTMGSSEWYGAPGARVDARAGLRSPTPEPAAGPQARSRPRTAWCRRPDDRQMTAAAVREPCPTPSTDQWAALRAIAVREGAFLRREAVEA